MTAADATSGATAPSPFASISPALIAAGYSPIPIRPDAKSPGEYSLSGEWTNKGKWQRWCREVPGPTYIERWSTWPGANVGVCCGRGLFAFDIDSDEHVEPILARLPPVLVAKRGRKGLTAFFRGDTSVIRSRGFRIRVDGNRLGVLDLIAEGKQTVLPPSIHPDTQEPYQWTTERTLANTRLEDLPECTQEHVRAVEEYLRAIGCEDADPITAPAIAEASGLGAGGAFRDLNEDALANLSAWVPRLGLSRYIKRGQGFRAVAEWRPSYSGKPLSKREYHVSFNPKGIVDYGDGEQGLTPIDVVMAAKGLSFDAATSWLREALGHVPPPVMVLNQKRKPAGHVKPERPAHPVGASAAPFQKAEDAHDDDNVPPEPGEPWSAPLAFPGVPAAPTRLAYPAGALGPNLGAAAAIARKVQCPVEMAANAILSVACLGAQGLADVKLPFGQVRPISLFSLTVAESGDRKSGADNEAMAPIRIREGELREIEAVANRKHAVKIAAWRAEHDKIKRGKSPTLEARAKAFELLGPQPEAPLRAILTTPDATHEGLAANMPTLPGSFGIFSDEGAKILGGHGFTPENKASTGGNLSSLWDSGTTRRVRAGAGIMDHQGRRVAMHLMIQPSVAATVAADPALRGQGLLARFLVAAPDTMAGGRFWKEPRREDAVALNRFTGHVLNILRAHPEGNELEPRVLEMDAEAREAWIEYYNRVEREQARGGRSESYRDVAGKSAEQAARIAGVLAIFEDKNADEISGDVMIRACMLADWYLAESIRFFGLAEAITSVTDADVLRKWIGGRQEFKLREVMNGGPSKLRTKKAAMAAIETLEAAECVRGTGKKSTWAVLR